jgi:ferritin-like metal-binding protein YciE
MATQSKTQKSSGSSGASGKSGATSRSAGKSGAGSRSATSNGGSRTGSARGGSAASARGKETQPGSLLEKFFHDAMKDLYYAEKQLVKTLPKMRKAATTPQLQSAFETHLAQTQEQVTRLEEVFRLVGKRAQAKKCPAMDGLITEGEEAIEETKEDSLTRDVALIMSAQKVEHYEIAAYGTLAQLAKTMGKHDAAILLEKTLDEEKETDMILTHIAKNNINDRAEMENAAGRASSGQQGGRAGSQGQSSGKGMGSMSGMSGGKNSGGRSGGR